MKDSMNKKISTGKKILIGEKKVFKQYILYYIN